MMHCDVVPYTYRAHKAPYTGMIDRSAIQSRHRMSGVRTSSVATQGERCTMRPSGTEPVMRFFIDMPDQNHVQSAMDDAVSVLHGVPVRL